MPIHDISIPVSASMLVWPRDPPVVIEQPRRFELGDHAQVSHLHMSAHSGTHVDAPGHFIPGGATVDTLDMEVLVGPALVVYAPQVDVLSATVLRELSIPQGTRRVLFRTRNSDLWARNEAEFDESYVALSEDGAEWLIHHGVQLVGIDYLSVALFADTGPTHRLLLGAGVILVETLNLSGIEPGLYQLVCLPLRLENIEGAPARAILID